MLDKFGSRSLRGECIWDQKIGLRFMYQSTPAIIFWLGIKLSNCILCLKYFTCEGGIFPNRWSEYFEHTTQTNSKKFGPLFVYTLKTTSVCAPFQGNDEEQIYPLFERLNLWRSYFSQSLKWIFWALNTYNSKKVGPGALLCTSQRLSLIHIWRCRRRG